jgi:hypothetical protein
LFLLKNIQLKKSCFMPPNNLKKTGRKSHMFNYSKEPVTGNALSTAALFKPSQAKLIAGNGILGTGLGGGARNYSSSPVTVFKASEGGLEYMTLEAGKNIGGFYSLDDIDGFFLDGNVQYQIKPHPIIKGTDKEEDGIKIGNFGSLVFRDGPNGLLEVETDGTYVKNIMQKMTGKPSRRN